MSNAIVKKTEGFIEKFSSKQLQVFAAALAPELKQKENYEEYKGQLATLLISNPTLASYDPKSLILATVQAYKEGLSFDPKKSEAYFIPYKDQIQFQKGYKAVEKELMRRHDVIDITSDIVYENDTFEIDTDSHGRKYIKKQIYNPFKDRGEMIGVYAFITYRLKTGEIVQNGVLLSKEEVEFYRGFSKSDKKMGKDSFWEKFTKDMWKKTAIHRLKNLLPAIDTPDYATLMARKHSRDEEVSEYRAELNKRFAEAFKNSGLTVDDGKKLIFNKFGVQGTDQLTDEQLLQFTEELEEKGGRLLDEEMFIGAKEENELETLYREKQLTDEQYELVLEFLGIDKEKKMTMKDYELVKNFLNNNETDEILKAVGWKPKELTQKEIDEAVQL